MINYPSIAIMIIFSNVYIFTANSVTICKPVLMEEETIRVLQGKFVTEFFEIM